MNALRVLKLIFVLSPILAAIVTARRMVKTKTMFSVLLFISCAISSLLFWSTLFFMECYQSQPGYYDDALDEYDHDEYEKIILASELIVVMTFSANIALLLVALFVKRCNIKKAIIGATSFFLVALFAIAIVVSILTGRGIDECFFGVCCGCLYATGMILGCSYKEICVIINIYLESGLCLLSILWVTWITIRRFIRKRSIGSGILMVGGIAYGFVGIALFLWICNHYNMPMNDAFDLCYHELIQLSKDYHTTYNNVNYIIFILLFLLITIGNMVIVKLLKNSVRKERLCNGSVTTDEL